MILFQASVSKIVSLTFKIQIPLMFFCFFEEFQCPLGTSKWGHTNDDIKGRGMKGHIYDISIQECKNKCQTTDGCGGIHWFPRNVCFCIYLVFYRIYF